MREEYRKYIRSETWQRKKYAYFGAHGRKCQACGTRAGIIHVHHKDYSRFGGRELLTDLCGLCDACHREVHRLHKMSGRGDLRAITDNYIRKKQR